MATQSDKLSALPAAGALDGTELVYLAQGGASKKGLLSAIVTFIGTAFAPKAHDHTTADATGPLTNDEHDGFTQHTTSAKPANPAVGAARIYLESVGGIGRYRVLHSSGNDFALFRDGGIQRVKNVAGVAVTKMQAVRFAVAPGAGMPGIILAKADAAATAPANALVVNGANNNAQTTVQAFGVFEGVDTSAWGEGDALYLSSTVAGGLTNVEPQHPYLSQEIGRVLVSHAVNGSIDIAITPAHEGDDYGTNRSAWKIGPGSGAAAVFVDFVNAFLARLSWTPTAARTLTLPDVTDTLVGKATTDTLTNKRSQPRITALSANSATPTFNTDNCDVLRITGQTAAITSMTTNCTGTPTHDEVLIVEITGTGAVGITWGAKFVASTVALPTTTVGTTMLQCAFTWDDAQTKWRLAGVC